MSESQSARLETIRSQASKDFGGAPKISSEQMPDAKGLYPALPALHDDSWLLLHVLTFQSQDKQASPILQNTSNSLDLQILSMCAFVVVFLLLYPLVLFWRPCT